MKSTFKGKPYPYSDPCACLDIADLFEPVFLHRSRRIDSFISLRPVCLPLDDEIVAGCALLGWTKKYPSLPADRVNAEKKVLKEVALSDSGQHFLGMVDGRPSFLAGLHKALQHQISTGYKARDKDYLLTLQIPPDPLIASREDLSLSLLQACLAHYFSYSGIELVLAKLNKGDLLENDVYLKGGFRFLQDAEDPFYLYYHRGAGYLDK